MRPILKPVLLACLSLLNLCIVAEEEMQRFEFSQPQMGVPFRIVLYAPDEPTALKASNAAFQKITHLNAILSDYDSDSELSKLSRTSGDGKKITVSPDLWKILVEAEKLSLASAGAFDVTIGPAVNLWRRARRAHELPAPEKLAEAQKRVGYKNLRLDPATHSAELLIPDMRLDLGGIAKGYAVDAAMQVLQSHGIKYALVGGDGDILVSAAPPGKPAWRIAIAQFDGSTPSSNLSTLLVNQAISTSGDLAQRLEINGRRYSHIVDPRTGIGLTNHSMVTIIAPTSMTADSLATTVSVLGPIEGLKLLANHEADGVSARILLQPHESVETHQTPNFSKHLVP